MAGVRFELTTFRHEPDIGQRLIGTIAEAMNWMERHTSSTSATTAKLARVDGIDDGEISRVFAAKLVRNPRLTACRTMQGMVQAPGMSALFLDWYKQCVWGWAGWWAILVRHYP